MNQPQLDSDNTTFAGTSGVSRGGACLGFRPAFLDTATGEARLSRSADGRIMPVHVLDGLPEHWVLERRGCRVISAKRTVIAGFLREGRFFTREQAARY